MACHMSTVICLSGRWSAAPSELHEASSYHFRVIGHPKYLVWAGSGVSIRRGGLSKYPPYAFLTTEINKFPRSASQSVYSFQGNSRFCLGAHRNIIWTCPGIRWISNAPPTHNMTLVRHCCEFFKQPSLYSILIP